MLVFGSPLDKRTRWEDLLAHECLATSDMSITSTLEEAAMAFSGGTVGDWQTTIFSSVDGEICDPEQTMSEMMQPIVTLDSSGAARIRASVEGTTWNELWLAVDDSLYPASLRRRVLITHHGGFGGGFPDLQWLTPALISGVPLLAAYVAGQVTSAPLKAAGEGITEQAREAIKRLRGDRAPLAVQHQARLWAEQGFDEFGAMLSFIFRRRSWTAQLLASRLRMEKEDAERLLLACAWKRNPEIEGTWVPTIDENSCVLRWLEADETLWQHQDRQ